MAHRLPDEAGASSRLALDLRSMTPAERVAGRFMRAPDHGEADDPVRRIEAALAGEAGEADAADGDVAPVVEEDRDGAAAAPDEEAGEIDEAGDEAEAADDAPPAVSPPVSWDAEAKALFAQLPAGLQHTIASREAQRERAIQAAQTDAAHARRNAADEASTAFAGAQRTYAQHLATLSQALLPKAPDPAIAAQDPGRYIALRAQYDAHLAQHQSMMQRAADARREADQHDAFKRRQDIDADNDALSHHFGERWTDEAQRQALLTGLTGLGAELGYTDLIAKANAQDLKALGMASEWKAKAEKYDALQRRKMEVVRQARDLPKTIKPNAPQPPGSAQARATQQQRARLRETGSVEDAAALIASRL